MKMRRCPQCDSLNDSDLEVCRVCSHELEEIELIEVGMDDIPVKCDHRTIYWKQVGLGGQYHCSASACDIPFSIIPSDLTVVLLDDHVAWCRYVNDGNRIVLCDSDAEGAFKVYRASQLKENIK